MSSNRFEKFKGLSQIKSNVSSSKTAKGTKNRTLYGDHKKNYSRHLNEEQKIQTSPRLLKLREQDKKVTVNRNSITDRNVLEDSIRSHLPNRKDARQYEKDVNALFPRIPTRAPSEGRYSVNQNCTTQNNTVLTSPRQTDRNNSKKQTDDLTKKDSLYIGSSFLVPVESPQISDKEKFRKYDDSIPKGLPNIGYTCYANSLLQVLCQTPNLYNHLNNLCRIRSMHVTVRYKSVTRALQNLLEEMTVVSKYPTSSTISSLMSSVTVRERAFEVGYQNDCHSFLLQILSGIEDENGKEACSMFEIQMVDEMYFSSCGHRETTDIQVMRSISVPSNSQHVLNGIDSLLEKEEFDEVDVPCRACPPPTKPGSKTIKRLRFERLPQILILQLGCFQETQYGGRLQISKSNTRIKYPTTLQLEVNNTDVIYHLYGVVNHFGSTYGGHYTSYVKNLTSSTNVRWYECNDSSVLLTNEQLVLNSHNAYILFYVRESQK